MTKGAKNINCIHNIPAGRRLGLPRWCGVICCLFAHAPHKAAYRPRDLLQRFEILNRIGNKSSILAAHQRAETECRWLVIKLVCNSLATNCHIITCRTFASIPHTQQHNGPSVLRRPSQTVSHCVTMNQNPQQKPSIDAATKGQAVPQTAVSYPVGKWRHNNKDTEQVTTASSQLHAMSVCMGASHKAQPSFHPLPVSVLAPLVALAAGSTSTALALGGSGWLVLAVVVLLLLLGLGLGGTLLALYCIRRRPDRVWGAAHNLGHSWQACGEAARGCT